MNKALPWNISGVGFDAREAARESARRQGKSLGEWLHGVIADHAAEIGVDERDVVSRERIQAVTDRLERMGEAANRDRQPRGDDRDDRGRNQANQQTQSRDRPSLVADEAPNGRRRAQRSRTTAEETELLLDDAIEAMEHRAQRAERRTDDALASFTRLLETNETRREQERVGVESLAHKLSDIEAKLSDRDESPIKGALARLEARLDQIGRRSEAEARARQQAPTSSTPEASELRRLEAKLNSVLEAVAQKPAAVASSVSPIAIAATQSRISPLVEPLRRRLGAAIADIAARQEILESAGAAPKRRATSRVADRDQPGTQDPRASSLGEMRGEIDALAHRFEDMRREMSVPRAVAPMEPALDIDAMRGEIATLAGQLHDLAPRGSVAALQGQISKLENRIDRGRASGGDGSVDELRSEVRAINRRVEEIGKAGGQSVSAALLQSQIEEIQNLVVRHPAPAAKSDVAALETVVRDLGRRIEAVRAPGGGQPAMEALQRQVGELATRLDSSEGGLASLSLLERSMQDLFAHLEETRSLAESDAARAAQDAVRVAIAEKGFDRPAPRADVAVLKAMQEDADLRTRAALDAVHATLEKVVDRLAFVETDLADARMGTGRSVAPSPMASPNAGSAQPHGHDLSFGAAEPMLDPIHGAKAGERGRRPAAPAPKLPEVKPSKPAPDDRAGKADFIAAARRAAYVAQTDPSVVAMKRSAGADGHNPVRIGLAAKSRDYVASHKRPVLLGLAAVFVIAGTMALLQNLAFAPGGAEVADAARPAAIVAAAEPSYATRPRRSETQLGALAPKALPKSTPAIAARIPGSDPVVTASIPSLPSFAARSAATEQARPVPPTLPAGLVSLAASGDGAAEYTLATDYAEGRVVPRDLERAAKLYAKAADKGIAPAQYRLGALYEKGLGVAQDKARAQRLYQQAADAGNPRAMHNLAVLLADGDGKPDYEGAATWFRKAAQYGVHDSEFNLAILLARGLGVDQSLVQSYQWFAIAAAQGDTDAAQKRDDVAGKLSASELSVAKALAAAFHPRSPDAAATEVTPPPGGWDGAAGSTPLNSARSKISSL